MPCVRIAVRHTSLWAKRTSPIAASYISTPYLSSCSLTSAHAPYKRPSPKSLPFPIFLKTSALFPVTHECLLYKNHVNPLHQVPTQGDWSGKTSFDPQTTSSKVRFLDSNSFQLTFNSFSFFNV